MPKSATSHRLSSEALQILAAAAAYHGISKTGVLEKLIREEGRAIGWTPPKKGEAAA